MVCREFEININKLKSECIYRMNLTVCSKNMRIVKGRIVDSNCKPCKGVAIEVKEINTFTKEKKLLGYAFTNDIGEYAFSIEVFKSSIYELSIYSPLS